MFDDGVRISKGSDDGESILPRIKRRYRASPPTDLRRQGSEDKAIETDCVLFTDQAMDEGMDSSFEATVVIRSLPFCHLTQAPADIVHEFFKIESALPDSRLSGQQQRPFTTGQRPQSNRRPGVARRSSQRTEWIKAIEQASNSGQLPRRLTVGESLA